jgi:DNA segregation ATPase FtsK/SpoIIIE, S-DNA-T family
MSPRRRKRKAKNISLNKYEIGIGLLIIGGLYFFALFLAQGSPLLNFFERYAQIAFGAIGVHLFFAMCIIAGLIILSKGYLVKTIIKQFVGLLVLASAIINFPVIDGESIQYEQYGGYISWPLIRLLDTIFGWANAAIKGFVLVLTVWLVWWILYIFNFSLPKLNLSIDQDSKAEKATKKTIQKTIAPSYHATETRSHQTSETQHSFQPVTESVIKSILKQKSNDKIAEKEQQYKPTIHFSKDKPTFPTSIMLSNAGQQQAIDESFLMEKAKALQSKLMEFNVPVSIEGFDIGPSIVQLKIKPDAGIKLSSIENLRNDITSSLRTKSLRIIAPIPGSDCVGIQIPNPKPMMVRLGDILSSNVFSNGMSTSISNTTTTNLSLGKAIDWSIVIKALDAMPHLLIAGATGSGKSVGVNDFILSLMYQNSPSELKFLMVDPKQVELEFYSGLPYMLGPIVTDPDQALKLLKRSVNEMETRYTTLKEQRVKNIDEYNAKFINDRMYRIVFVIDELADLMMSGNKKEVENCITRIAQKARAVGMHLIVATQRPSVNVITGLIKANIPTRIAFGVVSEVDSRTILGRQGAESLLGKGDLLYIDANTKEPVRIQAPYVDTQEIETIVSKLKDKYMRGLSENDVYDPTIIQILENKIQVPGTNITWSGSGWSDDELVEQAIQVIAQTRKASATLLQRKLNVGFARAARIMDILEEKGIIWPQEGAKARDIYL